METLEADPANALLGRMPRKRLSIEMWRDSMLSVAGRLDAVVGGTSIDVQDPKSARRTLYTKVSRLELDHMLQMFDYPDPNVHAARRSETTTPLQKLISLNNPFVIEQAKALSESMQSVSNDATAQVRWAYATLFAREPSGAELDLGEQFLSVNEESFLRQYAQVLLASNEMLYLD